MRGSGDSGGKEEERDRRKGRRQKEKESRMSGGGGSLINIDINTGGRVRSIQDCFRGIRLWWIRGR